MVKMLSDNQQEYLKQLGLSLDAIDVYRVLVEGGAQTASSIGARLGRFPSAQYRLLYRLEHYGLVRREGARPRRFVALPFDSGLSAAFIVRQQELSRLLKICIDDGSEVQPQFRLIIGRRALYAEYARLAPQAQKTIDAYTIGIAYSDELVSVQKAAIKRGVYIRHVIQQLKPSNYHIAHTWQRIGVNVRLSRAERGFHLMIFDSATAIIVFSDPTDTESRIGIVTDSQAIATIFGAQFNAIWQAARTVKP